MQTAQNASAQLRGLSDEDVAQRMAAGAVNKADLVTSRSLGQILRGNIFTLFNALLGSALLVIAFVGQWRDALFGLVMIANIAIGTIIEYRAKRTLDRLDTATQVPVRVIRAGQELSISSTQVVLDDLVRLGLGDQIPADADLLTCSGLAVDESMLTGESEPVSKKVGDQVLSGSTVVGGSALARISAVGRNAYVHRLAAQVRRFSRVRSELHASVNQVLTALTWIIIPIALLLFWNETRQLGGWHEVIADGTWQVAAVSAVAGVIAIVPDGLVLLTSVSFALAALTLARDRVLIQDLAAVEILARTDVVCLDKTGTITDGSVALDGVVEVTKFKGAMQALAAITAAPGASAMVEAIGRGLAHPDDGLPAADDPGPDDDHEMVIPFDSNRRWSGHRVNGVSWVLGAPEVLLAASKNKKINEQIRDLAATGARVLLLGRMPNTSTFGGDDEIPRGIRPALLILLRERARPDAAESLQYFDDQRMRLKLLSGDHPATVAAVGTGVWPAGAAQPQSLRGIDARELPRERADLAAAVEQEPIIGRATPERKREVIGALRSRGHTVAMVGDGVNDVLALKDADLGVATSRAAPATRAAARLVMLDGTFAAFPKVVDQGRRVLATLESVAVLFLTKTVYAVLLAVVVAVLSWPYPFLPRQLTLIAVLTVTVPAFAIVVTPHAGRYRRGLLDRVLAVAVPWGLVSGSAVLAAYGPLHLQGEQQQAGTAATLVLLVLGLWVLSIIARPWTRWRIVLVSSMAAAGLLTMVLPGLREFFELAWPMPSTMARVLLVVVFGAATIELVHRWRRWRPRARTDLKDR